MTYSIDDIAELIEYRLVACADIDDVAGKCLSALVSRISSFATRPVFHPAQ